MQKKIHRVTTLVAVVSIIVLGTLFECVGYFQYSSQCHKELQCVANAVLDYQSDPQAINDTLNATLGYSVRTTLISLDGTVTYDSLADCSTMQNHSTRKEFTSAVSTGFGEDTRYSESVGERTYYYAVMQGTSIVRLSRNVSSMRLAYAKTLPPLIVVLLGVVVVVVIVSRKLSQDTLQPVHSLVFQLDIFNHNINESPSSIVTECEELEPIAKTVQTLVDRIQNYIQNIREQKDRIHLITDNMVEGMIILDEKDVILSINRSAIRILNPTFTPTEDSTFLEFTDCEPLLQAIKDIKQEKNIKRAITIDDNHYKAYIHWTENIHGTIILLVDITETVKAEAVRHDFSANVSHELKTPLTTIKGFGELFENGLLTDVEDVKKYGAMIERESERLLFLINDIIRLSEIEEKTEKVLSPIDLCNSTEYAINLLLPKAQSKDISITLNSPESVVVNAHDGYMNELLINIIDNAIKYNKDGGSIVITLLEDSSKVTISVEDTGIGISQQDCERIFERFYRVDKSHSKKIGGTGLGLSIVKHIVNYHNGEIHIESSLGVGTTISIDIPKL